MPKSKKRERLRKIINDAMPITVSVVGNDQTWHYEEQVQEAIREIERLYGK